MFSLSVQPQVTEREKLANVSIVVLAGRATKEPYSVLLMSSLIVFDYSAAILSLPLSWRFILVFVHIAVERLNAEVTQIQTSVFVLVAALILFVEYIAL